MARSKRPHHPDETRLRLLGWVNACSLAAGLLLSLHLWIGDTSYPTTPVLPGLPALPRAVGILGLIALLALAFIAAAAKRPRRYWIALVVTGGLLVLLDQNRLQPWFYYYLFTSIALAWAFGHPRRNASIALDGIRVMLIGIYAWAGIQKLNASFVNEVFPWVIEPALSWAGALGIGGAWKGLASGAALTETSIGVGLLFPRTRKAAVIAAAGMHGFLLVMLGPLGHDWNSVVWPWNIAMVALVATAFWGVDGPLFPRLARPRAAVQWVAAALFIAAPALSFVGVWDAYLSAKLYSGNTESAYLLIPSHPVSDLPAEMAAAAEGGMVSVGLWSMEANNVPTYPARRLWKSALIQAHQLGLGDDARLLVRARPNWRTGEADWTVYSLGAHNEMVVDEAATRLLASR